ncbi:MAG: hypothetical protein LBE36_07990, partial [Flavobacteriaceae bacterium]|nr:hypothetical protein [Flavobacteriaceae bacterium]
NLAYTTAAYAATGNTTFTIQNMKNGGTYTLVVKSATSANAGTAVFTQTTGGTLTFHYVNNGTTSAGKHTMYTFIIMGTDAYVWMTSGF